MATIDQWVEELVSDIQELRSSKANKLLGRLAQQGFADSKQRVFTDGIKSDGTPIGTYAESTEQSKKRRGRFSSSRINLRETEKLVDSYRHEQKGSQFILGFEEVDRDGITNAELVDILEDKYGAVFQLSGEEENRLDEIIDQFEVFE